jgi:hypothetical protein
MEPVYLNPSQISALNAQAANTIWRYPILAMGHKNWYGIFKVSTAGLIHFYGNTHTGWQHIIDRHGYYSEELYFGDGSLSNPSKFPPGGIPVFDWSRIADEILLNGQIDQRPHQDEGLFIKYKGVCDGMEFSLILYRGTNIVHSLYPKKHMVAGIKKPKTGDLRRAFKLVNASTNITSDWLVVNVPYVDFKMIVRYILIFRIDLHAGIGEAHLQVNAKDGHPLYCCYALAPLTVTLKREDVISETIEFTRFVNTLGRFDDLSTLEEVIMKIENQA